jgi:formylglycine-generating enzyme required for sulfatase activity
MLVRALFLFTALGLSTLGNANNIVVSNVSLTGQNISAGANNAANFALVQFDLSWENSWRLGYTTGVNNWDAAWVFVKYRVNGGNWTHAYLNDTGHDDGSGTTLDIEAGLLTPGSAFNATTNPALGCFFYRNAAGTGNISNTALQLRWNYGANGLNDNDLVEVKVYAIEMAYVPQGGFDAGESSPINPLANDASSASVTFQLTGNGSNGGTTFTDESAAANAITRNGTVYSTAQAKFGESSVYFDGSDDRLRIGAGNDADFNFGSGDFTIELYVRPNGTTSRVPISFLGGSYCNAEGWSITLSTTFSFQTYNSGCNAVFNQSGGTISANTWYHLAVTRSGSTIVGYLDGVQVFSGTHNGALHTTIESKLLQLGERYYNGDSDFLGYISHVRITKGVARPATEFAHAAHDLLGHLRSATESLAMRMGSESAITLGGTASGNLVSQTPGQTTADDFNSGTTKSLGANFPKGSKAFYCMKTEISQQQYVNFLNTLTRAQQNARTATALGAGTTAVTNRYVMSNTSTLSNRNGIRCDASIHTSNPITFYCDFNGNGTGGEAGDGGWIACNFLSWADGAAYMDWAGLRPMSELEFEKAARGSRINAVGEYAWGSNSATAAATLSNSGANNETVSTGNAIYGTSAIGGPMRTGAFAKSGTGRSAAGGSLYGILDLSGNVEERTVSLGLDSGRVFTGAHGNGALAASGNADVTAWPTFTANGAGFRGGAWNTVLARLRTSDRLRSNVVDATRAAGYGFRGVRTVQCTAPTASITLSGTQLFNFTNPNQTYTASGGTDYLWSISPDFALSSGQGTNSINTTGPNSSALGVIYCADVNSCGTGPETRLNLFSVASSWPTILASGGTISSFIGDGTNGTNGVAYVVHSFTTVGTSAFVPFVPISNVEYLVIGGGGGGGNGRAGGGGAGGYLTSSINVQAISYTVTVGAGGASGQNGSQSIFGNITASGGGKGGGNQVNGSSGGSGGGGGGNWQVGAGMSGGTGTAGQGNNGGNGSGVTGAWTSAGGGGGGAGGAGSNAPSSEAGGNGGNGLSSLITGTAVTRAGGGGGGVEGVQVSQNRQKGLGGSGGGGDGAGGCCGSQTPAVAGAANTGSGGGGGDYSQNSSQGAAGGSGVVIVRYPMP